MKMIEENIYYKEQHMEKYLKDFIYYMEQLSMHREELSYKKKKRQEKKNNIYMKSQDILQL